MKEEYQSRAEKNKHKNERGSLFRNRKKKSTGPRGSGSAFDKIFYILIAFLFLLLIAVVIFIMNFTGSSTEEVSEDLVQNEDMGSIRDLFADDPDQSEGESEPDGENQTADQDENQSEDQNQEVSADEDAEEETEEDSETQGDQSLINENPPHDPGYAVDYSDGSGDRVEIRNKVSAVTGIPENDLIENWIGNDGPGRVEATVTQYSTGNQYVVYLQYGEGQWHVESVNPQ